ncbi:MAG: hypothetical protein KIS66_09965 [Fimbriimonadaceae bacterium]|nr:hypothetical protein [Fimbriimonadaceae bacterium]
MRPLLFLTTRSVVNGVRRAFTSPKRLITMVAVLAYYFFFFVRPTGSSRDAPPLPDDFKLTVPPMAVMDAVAFAGFGVMSLVMLLGMLSHRSGFRPADVDVLFPTPVSPRIVLGFRVVREYLVTLLTPFILILFGWRGASQGIDALKKVMPDAGSLAIAARVGMISWFLMALFWVAISYAVSMWVNSNADATGTRRRWLMVGLGAAGLLLAVEIALSVRRLDGPEGLIDLANGPILRTVLFSATLSAQTVTAALQGHTFALAGLFALQVALIAGAWTLAFRQAGELYDQAAARGFDTSRQLQRQGDLSGVRIEEARKGKLKAGRRTWVHGLRLRGARALLWKEWFLQTRGSTGMLAFFLVITLVMNGMPGFMPEGRRTGSEGPGYLFLVMQMSTLFMVTMTSAQSGVIDLLRHVDLQKPLPFQNATNVFFEVVAKSLFGILFTWAGSLVFLAMKPLLWKTVVAAVVWAPATSLMVSSVVYLFSLLFPDIEDPTQRGFRQLMVFVGIIVGFGPSLGAFILLMFLKTGPIFAAIPAALLALGVTVLATFLSGNLYRSFNPSE